MALVFERLSSSDRLIYQAANDRIDDDKETFYNTLLNDPISHSQLFDTVLKPLSRKLSNDMLNSMADSLLGVTICLPTECAKNFKTAGDEEVSSMANPTSIGWLSLSLKNSTPHQRSCELAIHIMPAYHGKGHGTEAISWASDWSFRIAGMHSVRLRGISFNEGVLRLYDRMGFVRDGIKRESNLHDGLWYDRVLFSILDREWMSVSKPTSKTMKQTGEREEE